MDAIYKSIQLLTNSSPKFLFLQAEDLKQQVANITNPMTSQYKITIKNSQLQLILDCKALEREVFKILKSLNENNKLFILPKDLPQNDPQDFLSQSYSHSGTPYRRSSRKTKQVPKRQYCLNSNEALQIIWRSAFIAKQVGINESEIEQIRENKYVGETNKMEEEIHSLTNYVKKLEQKPGSKKAQLARKLRGIAQKMIDAKIRTYQIWSNIRNNQKKVQQQLQHNSYVSLANFSMENREKQLVLKFLKDKIIEIDRLLFRDSLVFVLPIKNTDDCVVSFETSYNCWITKRSFLQQIIGYIGFQEAKNDFQLSKQAAQKQGLEFRPSIFKCCHICLDILIPKREDFVCENSLLKTDSTSTPFMLEEILLKSNYGILQQAYNSKSKPRTFQPNQYRGYTHPFLKTYTPTCGRFICSNCMVDYVPTIVKRRGRKRGRCSRREEQVKREPEQQETVKTVQTPAVDEFSTVVNEKSEVSSITSQNDRKERPDQDQKGLFQPILERQKPEKCNFCISTCVCQRCKRAEHFNKQAAIYQSLGGDFMNEITQFLIFQNLKSQSKGFSAISLEEFDEISQIQLKNSQKSSEKRENQEIDLPEDAEPQELCKKDNNPEVKREEDVEITSKPKLIEMLSLSTKPVHSTANQKVKVQEPSLTVKFKEHIPPKPQKLSHTFSLEARLKQLLQEQASKGIKPQSMDQYAKRLKEQEIKARALSREKFPKRSILTYSEDRVPSSAILQAIKAKQSQQNYKQMMEYYLNSQVFQQEEAYSSEQILSCNDL